MLVRGPIAKYVSLWLDGFRRSGWRSSGMARDRDQARMETRRSGSSLYLFIAFRVRERSSRTPSNPLILLRTMVGDVGFEPTTR